jgi:CBS domain-containing protein
MTTVRQLLQAKGHNVWTIDPEALVIDALKLMAEKRVGALLVVEGEKLVGVLSERDYARKVELLGQSALNSRVKEIMTREVLYVRPEQTVEDCMALMTTRRVRHLPVFSDDQLAGIVTIGDIVKAVISEQEFMIEQLENYIISSKS